MTIKSHHYRPGRRGPEIGSCTVAFDPSVFDRTYGITFSRNAMPDIHCPDAEFCIVLDPARTEVQIDLSSMRGDDPAHNYAAAAFIAGAEALRAELRRLLKSGEEGRIIELIQSRRPICQHV